MAYVDLEVAYSEDESPNVVYKLLAEGLPVRFTVVLKDTDDEPTTYPVVRFFGDEDVLRQLVHRWETTASVEETPKIHPLTLDEHHEVIMTMATELGEAIARDDLGAADHLFDRLSTYVEQELGHRLPGLVVIKEMRDVTPTDE